MHENKSIATDVPLGKFDEEDLREAVTCVHIFVCLHTLPIPCLQPTPYLHLTCTPYHPTYTLPYYPTPYLHTIHTLPTHP